MEQLIMEHAQLQPVGQRQGRFVRLLLAALVGAFIAALVASPSKAAEPEIFEVQGFWEESSDWFEEDGSEGWEETEEEWDWEEEGGDEWSDFEEGEWEMDLSEPTGDDPLAYVCYRDGREKPITPREALWLAKMVDGETGGSPSQEDADAMLWTLIQRTDLPSFKNKSVEYLTRAYSQPINHRWLRTGKYCKKYYEDDYTGEVPDKCSASRTKRRAENIAKGWDDTAEMARRTVLEFVGGSVPNPVIGAIGWFDSAVWRRGESNGKNSNRELVAEIERNTFYARISGPSTVAWDEWEITVVPADQFCPEFVGEESFATFTHEDAPESQEVTR